jgi:hypothetical protein
MKEGAYAALAAAARFYAPLIVLFALALLLARPAGSGVGFVSGLVFLLGVIVHTLVFGAAASRAAMPAMLMRVLVASGLVMAAAGAGLPGVLFARELVEAGAFVVTAAGGALMVLVLFGRAPTMRDAGS